MMKYYDGTVFNAGCDTLVNTINTDGFMGKGIALEFALRYRGLEDWYAEGCENGEIHVNRVSYYDAENVKIVCFPTKMHFQFPSRLDWIEAGLKDFAATYKQKGITSVAFPRLGCANGGLKWDEVRPLMERYLEPLDIEVVICLDSMAVPKGKEKDMVEAFNNTSVEDIATTIRLTKSQKESLCKAQPISRFWKIGDIQGIGIETYRKLFKFFYENNGVQLTLPL